jgi:hypothetical protein
MASIATIQKQINRKGEELAYFEKQLPQLQAQLANPVPNTPGQRAFLQSQIAKTQENIAAIEAVQVDLEAQLEQQLNRTGQTSSAADTTASAQVARDDGANTSAAPAVQKETGPDGRVATKTAAAPTNADKPKTTATGDTDQGTNAPVRTLTQTQTASSGLPPAEIKLIKRSDGTYVTQDGTPVPGVEVNGVGSRGDDAAQPANSVVNRLDELYAGAQNAIVSQDNILDQFASYTYSLSWYLLDHATYNSLATSDTKYIDSYYLLMQSGGASITTRSPNQTVDPQQAAQTGAGRNPFFTLDYYMDNFVIENSISCTPGSRGAAKLTSVSFTVTEPNGISLQPNLIRAVNDLYWKNGYAKTGTTINYNEAQYVMVVRFYGYDSQGNLVIPIDNRRGVTDRQAAVEKFIPFKIVDIQFKVANKLVEYSITGVPTDQLTAFSTDRGSIPQSFQFQGATVGDILVGSTQTISDLRIALENDARVDNESRTITQGSSTSSTPPPKASAAPYKVGNIEATGLCAALNLFYAEEARSRKGIADVYELQFLDPMLSNASIVPPGSVDKAFAGGNPNATAATNLDPNRQYFNPKIRVRSATAGQQIVQFIDEIMRSSSYISDQQKATWEVDPKTKIGEWKFQGKTAQNFAWFDITCDAQVIGYDTNTRANAYRMIYKVAPYQTSMIATSEYFNPSAFRGVHKVYNYWFTGQNTQVLQFEQSFNNLWKQTISSNSPTSTAEFIKNQVNSRVMYSKRFMPASNQTREGATGDVYEAAANAADMLYTTDLVNITLDVIGDPAWIASPKTPQPGKFVVTPFYPDGTINYNAGVPYFEFAWNRPVDYNLETGLMDPGQNNYFADRAQGRAGLAQESVIYMTTNVKSTFARGKFTQQLVGAMLQDGQNKSVNAATAFSSTANQFTDARDSDDGTRRVAQGDSADLPTNAGAQLASNAERDLATEPDPPTAESPGNAITGNTVTQPLAATPPVQTAESAAVAAPSKLPPGGFGSGANNPSLAGTSAAPQLIAKEA